MARDPIEVLDERAGPPDRTTSYGPDDAQVYDVRLPPPDRRLRRARRFAMLSPMAKWEYATVPLIVHATKQILDQWGEDGWELVQVLSGDGGNLVAYLKRER